MNADARVAFERATATTAPQPWTIRTPRGGTVDSDAIAAASGLRIWAVVTASCILFGLSVVWRGDVSTTAAGFWPPAGAALVAMLVVPMRRWGWVIGGILTQTVVGVAMGMMPVGPALWWAAANIVQPVLGALIVLRFGRSRNSLRGAVTPVFFLGAVVFATFVGATFGATGTVLAYDRSWGTTWLEWAVGDGLGVLVMVPLLMTYTSRAAATRTWRERSALGATVAIAAALGFAHLGTQGSALLPYLILAVLLWAGMRFGQRAAASAGFVVALASNLAASQGWGPFADGAASPNAISLQIFLAIALVTSFVVASTVSELADRDEVHGLLTQQATHDSLTGLPNRLMFEERLRHAFESRQQFGHGVGLALIDLNDFKKINDRHGHPAGDHVLGVIAQQLTSSVRSNFLLARIGGDEFVMLCEEIDGTAEILATADVVSASLQIPIEFDGFEHHLSGSIGVAVIVGDDTASATELFRRADIALYESKRHPDLRVALFDDELEARTQRQSQIEAELRGAIARDELSVAYQPIVSLPSEAVVGFEALLRWTNRRLGTVGPDEFIEIAERTGLIGPIGDWVLEVACRQLAASRAGDGDCGAHPGAHMNVNVSTRQLRDRGFPARVRRILESASLPPEALILEITETAMMDDLDVTKQALAHLRRIGVQISMDDFGTGYSSMTYLRMLPVDSLKIDRTFVADIGGATNNLAIVRAILLLGAELGLDVIAEGIETTEQAETLMQLGCRLGQGYLYGRPAPTPDFDGRLCASLPGRRA